METFKTIVGFPDYEISNLGRVKTKSREIRYTHAVTKQEHKRKSTTRILKIYQNTESGYLFVQLYKEKKMYNRTIHRLVAEMFLERKNYDEHVNHKDGNKQNNCVENLEWCSASYNHEHATRNGLKARGTKIASSRLNERCVKAIRNMLTKGYSHQEISDIFEVSRTNITMIANKKTWNFSLTGEELEINLS